MTDFEQWWEKEEDLMRKQGANDEIILGAMRSIAEMAWDAAINAAAQLAEERNGNADCLYSAASILGKLAGEIEEMKNDSN